MKSLGRIVFCTGFYTGFLSMTLICLLVSPLAFLFLRYGKNFSVDIATRELIWTYGYLWTKLLRIYTPVIVTGCGKPFPEPSIIVLNHQSFFDAFCLGFAPTHNLAFVVRAWPFKIPCYAPFMCRAGYLNTEALDAETFMERAKNLLALGVTLVIYPEGTRSCTSELGRFHSGAFSLAVQSDVPIVPLCLDNMGAFLRKGAFFPHRVAIRITALAPVYPKDFAVHGDTAHMVMRREVKQRMQKILNLYQQEK